jgi:hypothetical protein
LKEKKGPRPLAAKNNSQHTSFCKIELYAPESPLDFWRFLC